MHMGHDPEQGRNFGLKSGGTELDAEGDEDRDAEVIFWGEKFLHCNFSTE